MNYAAFVYTTPEPILSEGLRSMPNCQSARAVPLRKLHECVRQELPLDLNMVSATKEDGFVVYNVTIASTTTTNTCSVSYRYSQFDAFRSKVQEQLTCHNAKCYGSCQAIRDYLSVAFPKKRLAILSNSSRAIADRKTKFENVLLHLLRCVLIPGSSMKCLYARRHLAKELFRFLGVEDAVDQRSLLQVFADNRQDSKSRWSSESSECDSVNSSDSTVDSVASEQCTICLDDVEQDPREPEGGKDQSAIVLACGHTFHRECIFEWLLFEFHCPMCRAHVGSSAVTNYCRIKSEVQWWLGDFVENPLGIVAK